MSRPILYLTIGLPRSGKTTWARRQRIPIVNPDAIRLAIHGKAFDLKFEDLVWFHARIMIESLFKAGHELVILDATNITKARRDRWLSDQWERAFVVFPEMDLQLLKERCDLVDTPHLKSVIDRMAAQFEPVNCSTEPNCLLINGYETKVIVL